MRKKKWNENEKKKWNEPEERDEFAVLAQHGLGGQVVAVVVRRHRRRRRPERRQVGVVRVGVVMMRARRRRRRRQRQVRRHLVAHTHTHKKETTKENPSVQEDRSASINFRVDSIKKLIDYLDEIIFSSLSRSFSRFLRKFT